MSALSDILERRARLIAEAETQRRALGEGIAACRSILVVADRSIALAHWLRAKPYVVIALVTAIAVLRPRFALAWSGRLIALWRVGQLMHHAFRLVADRALGQGRLSRAIRVGDPPPDTSVGSVRLGSFISGEA